MKVIGWILVVWGSLGVLSDIATLPYWTLELLCLNFLVCLIFIVGGIAIIRRTSQKPIYAVQSMDAFCPYCGASNWASYTICSNCGRKVKEWILLS